MMYIIGTKTPVEKLSDQSSQVFAHYLVSSEIDGSLMQRIINWLADNCQDNFSVTVMIERTVAGNSPDNRKAASQGLFLLDSDQAVSWFDRNDRVSAYRIRISGHDAALFSLVWLDLEQGC